MGIIHKGVPHRLALSIAESIKAETFVETGTHMGKSAEFAKQWFRNVITIEKVPHYYDSCNRRLRKLGIQCYLGDSPVILEGLVAIRLAPCFFWLDAHWSPDLHAPRQSVICPVLEEIKVIDLSSQNHAIMVDDARLFGCTTGWPNKEEVIKALEGNGRRVVYEEDDVIYALPVGRSVAVEEI